jgi:fructose-1,6-bisphosphatase/inositol monophosphatase family enzyme
LPDSAAADEARWQIIVDPIDGTRGLMYQKRPGWILTGVAPNRGSATSLADIVLAVQTEIPLLKQHLTDQLWAVRGRGAHGVRFNRLTHEATPLTINPSTASDLRNGFATVCRFFSWRPRCLGVA